MSQILHAHAAPPAVPLVDLLERAFSEAGLGALDRAGVANRVPRSAWEAALLGPARALLSRPGKGFRESLVRLCWSIAGGRGQMPPVLPLIVEIIHAGSLVIDDVEDDSSLRRGGACLHRLYGVPIAINVGNWMYFWALDLVGGLGLPDDRAAALQRALTQGMFRCHFGQALDLSRPVGRIPQGEMAAIVDAATALKTGALMELAARAGAIAAGAAPATTQALARFGGSLGRGLQMLDDLGNIGPVADGDANPKRHEDLRLGRATWPWAWAADALDEISFAALQADARVVHAQAAAGRPAATEALAASLRSALGVQGRRLARRELARGVGELARAVGPRPEIPHITAEIARLEASYG
ncbi:MAG TPA: polyprenyl synthetase family protein [Polyangia bacterium]|nr:polyprenyl synthetase family protein [Polyangia bacterium]